MSRTRHITLPQGFVASGITCGIKASGKPDLAILAANATSAGAFVTTTNQIIGAPVQHIRTLFPKGHGRMRAIVINSGNSNVCTGKTGLRDAATMGKLTAKQVGCPMEEVLVASTGVIGHKLPMDKIKAGIVQAGESLSLRNDDAAAKAILTTDLSPKTAVVQVNIDGVKITVAGIAKGSGMIAPSLATMIAALTTDAKITPALLHKLLKQAVHPTFNAVTVDSDTSTSDTVAILASGAAGGAAVKANTPAYKKLLAAVTEVCDALAYAIVADGEGATRVAHIVVKGAANDAEAELAAKSVANSPLVKTALHGADPNWGRFAMALGKSPAKVVAETLTIKVGPHKVFAKGTGCRFDEKAASKAMQEAELTVTCNLGLGKGTFTAHTCDLSREYIAINADYTT